MGKTQEEIQLKISGKVGELRRALVKQEGITRLILDIHRRVEEEVYQEKIDKVNLATYTRDNGNGNEFEDLVNEISCLFQEYREIEKEDIYDSQ